MDGDSVRTWGWVGFAAQVVFVVSWLIAPAWQGSDYDSLKHSISDMYAQTAPDGWFLVVVLTLCGLATVLFALLAVRPALRGGGRRATVGAVLLALSIYGVGDLFSPFERENCRLADTGCTGSDQTANLGGKLDNLLSTLGILLFVAAAFVLASAMRRTPGWPGWAWPARCVGIIFAVLLVALALAESAGLGGLVERLLAGFGSIAIGALAWRIARRPAARTLGARAAVNS
ncbi:DUF998 domain-containing protein [Actinoplanes sp. KI2]|uniref:DUF998 domain-containing protein n=1 Tax=Actinoplanes sp. KI2 TaxID=2983315 RepID=UPI0021D5F3EC|nr:DUF998 domain-containing protein [Actinoplanes sp. KI2]MCU7726899.1 DUF998 domain-containing protein [Actinoplanes sp. KI2]